MRNIISLIVVLIVLGSCGSKTNNQFTVTGTILGADSGMVYLQKRESGKWVKLDSANIEKGTFSFRGMIASPEMWYISYADRQVHFPFFVESSDIGLTLYPDSLDKSIVSGSETYAVYKKYTDQVSFVNDKQEELYAEYKKAREANDTVQMNKIDSISTGMDEEMKKLIIDFAKSNAISVVSPYLLARNFWRFELLELEDAFSAIDTTLNGSVYYQTVKERISVLKKVAIGQPAVEFTMNDSLGNPVPLSSFRGSYLLVDFWASWCGPCRAENPNVVKAYQGYHSKGFDILGVSFDKSREKWIKATKDDNLTWNHVSDLAEWDNAAGKLYGISSIPSNVLLDKDQVIIARNLRGEDLQKKLAELLGPPAEIKTTKKHLKK